MDSKQMKIVEWKLW